MLTLIPARPEDIRAIFEQNKQLIDLYEDISAIDYPKVLHWVHRNIENTLPCFHRILWDGELAGYYCLLPGGEKWEIDSLFVLPKFQGKGIGTEILKLCRRETSLPLFLYVFRKNARAVKLYQRMGFQIIQEVGNTRYIMEWKIPDC